MGRKATFRCPRGHVKNDANSYVDAKGHRRCRACTLARNKAWAAGQGGTGQGGTGQGGAKGTQKQAPGGAKKGSQARVLAPPARVVAPGAAGASHGS